MLFGTVLITSDTFHNLSESLCMFAFRFPDECIVSPAFRQTLALLGCVANKKRARGCANSMGDSALSTALGWFERAAVVLALQVQALARERSSQTATAAADVAALVVAR